MAIDGSGYIKDQGVRTCPGAVPGQFGTNVRTGAIVFSVPAQAHALYVGSRGIGAQLAKQYLGQVLVNSEAQGQARFDLALEQADGLKSFTATVTTVEGATSELSRPLAR